MSETLTQQIHRQLQANGLMPFSYPRLRIGLDLDDTVYAYPTFFRAFIDAMHAAGHKLVCVSGHGRSLWEKSDVTRLRALGIDPLKLDPSGMAVEGAGDGRQQKADNFAKCDFVFDDEADDYNQRQPTPVFKAPPKRHG